MSYKHREVTGIRKMRWDKLWHILYLLDGQETYDRVSKEEALLNTPER